MSRSVRILCNPSSGSYSAGFIARVREEAKARGAVVEVVPVASADDMTARAMAAVGDDVEVVGVYGGDGAVNLVAGPLVGSDVALAVLPGGTANVLAKELGVSRDPADLGAMLAEGTSRPATVGLIGDATFLLMVGIGFDAAAVRGVNREIKRVLGQGAYFLSALTSAFARGATRLDLRVDSVAYAPAWVVISKSRLYAGNFVLAPGASVWSETFQVVMFDRSDPMALVRHVSAIATGAMTAYGGVEIVEARRVEVLGPRDAPVQVDGDPFRGPPLEVGMSGHRLKLIAP